MAIDSTNQGMVTNIGVAVSATITRLANALIADKKHQFKVKLKILDSSKTYIAITTWGEILVDGADNFVSLELFIYPHKLLHILFPAAGYNKWLWAKVVAN